MIVGKDTMVVVPAATFRCVLRRYREFDNYKAHNYAGFIELLLVGDLKEEGRCRRNVDEAAEFIFKHHNIVISEAIRADLARNIELYLRWIPGDVESIILDTMDDSNAIFMVRDIA